MHFRGIANINLDTKGRMAMPKKYRPLEEDTASGVWVATIDINDPCVLIYPVEAWEKIEQQLMALPNIDPMARRLQRLLLGHATELEPDTQGRMLLPNALRDYAGLTKEALLVGQGNKLELWDQQRWDTERDLWLQEAKADEGGVVSPQISALSL